MNPEQCLPASACGEVTLPPTSSRQPPLGDLSPLSIHWNINSVHCRNRLRQSPGLSVLQPPTIQGAATIGSPGPVTLSLSSMSLTMPSGASALQYPKSAMAWSIVVCGPVGIGKSLLILAYQTNWWSSGLWGCAKMVKGKSSPFTGLVHCCASFDHKMCGVN